MMVIRVRYLLRVIDYGVLIDHDVNAKTRYLLSLGPYILDIMICNNLQYEYVYIPMLIYTDCLILKT